MGSGTWLTTSLFTLCLSFFSTVTTLFWATERSSDLFSFSPKVLSVCLTQKHTDMGNIHTANRVFLFLISSKILPNSWVEWNQTHQPVRGLAGMSQEHEHFGRYILTGKLKKKKKKKHWEEVGGGICVSQGEVEVAGDVVATLLWDSHCVFWDCALPVCLSHPYQMPRPLSTCVWAIVGLSFVLIPWYSERCHNKQDHRSKQTITVFSWLL